ncbi:MAG: hypothetical protein ACREO1_12570, partial [Arenimonas sp.]
MSAENCFWGICFVPIDAGSETFFGFSEYLTGLALLVLAWTIADVRYHFRVRTAPLPLEGLTFGVVGVVGILTLISDWWRAEHWHVPEGNLLTVYGWQALLGGLFLATFLTWVWVAFIFPPVYTKRNAKRYAHALYRYILKGSSSELSVIADEFTRSVKPIVHFATDVGQKRRFRNGNEDRSTEHKIADVTAYANDILLLIADKRFCRAIVESSSNTALAFFQEISNCKKYGIQFGVFSKNISNEALSNKNSFLFHEAEGYESGLMGYHKPLSKAMYGNYTLVETVGTLLDPDISGKYKWDAEQWEAYCRVVLTTLRSYVNEGRGEHSFVLYRAIGNLEHASFDVYKVNGLLSGAWDDDVCKRLRVIVEFIRDVVEVLNERGVPEYLDLRIREKNRGHESFYDHFAKLIFEVIFSASAVRSPVELCWFIQYNTVWGRLMNFRALEGPAGKILQFKLRRLLYNEVVEMKTFPNFKGAKILGYCLNVMGLQEREQQSFRDSMALHKVILSWTKKNYVWLHSYN